MSLKLLLHTKLSDRQGYRSGSGLACEWIAWRRYHKGYSLVMGVSENRGPKYRTLNSRILIIRTPN